MSQKRTDALIQFGRNDVLEFACLRVRFGVVNREGVLEKPLRKPVPTNHVTRAISAAGREARRAVFQLDELQLGHARQHPAHRLFRQ